MSRDRVTGVNHTIKVDTVSVTWFRPIMPEHKHPMWHAQSYIECDFDKQTNEYIALCGYSAKTKYLRGEGRGDFQFMSFLDGSDVKCPNCETQLIIQKVKGER